MAVEGGYGSQQNFQAVAIAAQSAAISVSNLARSMALVQATTGALVLSTNAFAQLQQTLTLASSVADGTVKQFREMETTVRNFALATKFSASEGASALYFLASAGLSVQQSLTALNGVMLLAQATLSDVSTTADLVAASISAFKLQATDSTRVANLFAAAISASQADMSKLAYSMRQVAPIAGALGVSIEDTSTALSILYNVGLRGQQAGTGLRNMFVRLTDPTSEAADVIAQMGIAIQNTDGKMRDFKDILSDLSGINPDVATLTKLFERQTVAAAQALINSRNAADFNRKIGRTVGADNSVTMGDAGDPEYLERARNIAQRTGRDLSQVRDEFDLMGMSITNTQAAAKIAMQQMVTLAGSFATAKNSVSEFGIALGQSAAPSMRSFADALTRGAVGFRGMTENQQQLILMLPLLAAGVWGSVKAISAMTSAAASLSSAGIFAGQGPVRGIVTAIDGITSAFYRQSAALTAVAADGRRYAVVMQAMGSAGQRAAFAPGQAVRGLVPGGMANVQRGEAVYNAQAGQYMPVGVGQGGRGAQAFGAAMGAIGNVAIIGSIAMLAYQILPVIWDYFKNRALPGSPVGASSLGLDSDKIVQSTSLMSGTAHDKVRMLGEHIAQTQIKMEAWNEDIEVNTKVLNENGEALRKYLLIEAKKRGFGDNSLAVNRIKNANAADLSAEVLRFSDSGRDDKYAGMATAYTGILPGLVKSGGIKDAKEIAMEHQRAKAAVETLNKNTKEYEAAMRTTFAAQDKLKETVQYKDEEDRKFIESRKDEKVKQDLWTYISTKYLESVEKDQRAAIIAFNKARALLTNNPVETLLNQLSDLRETASSRLISDADAQATSFRTAFREHLTGIGGGLDTISQMATGQDYNNKGQLVQGWITLFQNGASPDGVREAFNVAAEEVMGRSKDVSPKVQENLRKVFAAARSQMEAILGRLDADGRKAVVDSLDTQRSNRDFVLSIQHSFADRRAQFLESMFQGGGGTDLGLKMVIDMSALNRQADNDTKALSDLEKQYFDRFDMERKNPERLAEWARIQASFKDMLAKNYVQGVKNIVNTFQDAQAKMLDELRSGVVRLKVGAAEMAGELGALMGAMGLQVPANLRQEAGQIDSLRQVQTQVDAITGLREQLRQLQSQQSGRNSAQGIPVPGAIAPAQLPAGYLPQNAPAGDITSRTNGILASAEQLLKAFYALESNGGRNTGRPTDRNGNYLSTAEGAGQFLNGTWLDVMKQLNIGTGMGKDAILALRQDINVMNQATAKYASNNANALTGAGHAATIGNTYLMHLLGPGGGLQFLSNARNAPNERVGADLSGGGNKRLFTDSQGLPLSNAEAYDKIMGEITRKSGVHADTLVKVGDTSRANNVPATEQNALGEQQIALTNKQIERRQIFLQLLQSEQNIRANTANSNWSWANKEIEEFTRLYERTGSVFHGIEQGAAKMRQSLQTDFQLGASLYSTFTDRMAGGIADLFTGTQKDWRVVMASMLRDMANMIIKALAMRAILGITGGLGIGNLFGGGNPVAVGSATMFESAKGNIVIPHGVGGHVFSKQYFPMANGGVGSISENGTGEVIMPMVRGSGGRMGVLGIPSPAPRATMPINSRGGNVGNVNFNPTFVYNGEGGAPGSGENGNSGGMSKSQSEQFNRELERETEGVFLRLLQKHSTPGGKLHTRTRQLGQDV